MTAPTRRRKPPRTHCEKHEVELVGENVKIAKDGSRFCVACLRDARAKQSAAAEARRRAAPPPTVRICEKHQVRIDGKNARVLKDGRKFCAQCFDNTLRVARSHANGPAYTGKGRSKRARDRCDTHNVDLNSVENVKVTRHGHRWCAFCHAEQVRSMQKASDERWKHYEPRTHCHAGHPRNGARSCPECKRQRDLISYYRKQRPDRLPNGSYPDADYDEVAVDRLVRGQSFRNKRGKGHRSGPTWAEILLAADVLERKRYGGPVTERWQKIPPAELAELIKVEEWKVREARKWGQRIKWTPAKADDFAAAGREGWMS